jgi:WD40 repeat protein
LLFTSSGATLVTISLDGTSRLWDTRTGLATHVLRHPGAPKLARCALSPDDKELWVGTADGALFVWDLAAVQATPSPGEAAVPVFSAKPSTHTVKGLSISMDGRLVCVCYGDCVSPEQGRIIDRMSKVTVHTFSFNHCDLFGSPAFYQSAAMRPCLAVGNRSLFTSGGSIHFKELPAADSVMTSSTLAHDVASIALPYAVFDVIVVNNGKTVVATTAGGVYLLHLTGPLQGSVSISALSARPSPTLISAVQIH